MSTTTEPIGARVPTPMPRRAFARRGRPRGFGVFIATVATFLVILSVLAWRMAAGEDPALSKVPVATTTAAPADPGVVHRRIVDVKVVHDPAPVAAVPAESATPAPVTAPTPVTSVAATPAPAPAPVAAAPAPAPAPAPTPVTSSS